MTVSVNANVFFLLHTLLGNKLGNLLAILFNEHKISFFLPMTGKKLICKQINLDLI